MRVTVVLDVPDSFVSDQLTNADLDTQLGRNPIGLPAHAAVRSLIESGPVRVRVESVELHLGGGESSRVDYPQEDR